MKQNLKTLRLNDERGRDDKRATHIQMGAETQTHTDFQLFPLLMIHTSRLEVLHYLE